MAKITEKSEDTTCIFKTNTDIINLDAFKIFSEGKDRNAEGPDVSATARRRAVLISLLLEFTIMVTYHIQILKSQFLMCFILKLIQKCKYN